VIVGVVACFAACSQSADTNAPLVARIAELERVSAQKDSLFTDLSDATALLTEIDQRLAALRSPRGRPRVQRGTEASAASPPTRESLLASIDSLALRLTATEARLEARRQEAGADASGTLTLQVAALRERLAEFRTQIDRQRLEIDDLTAELREVRAERVRLANDNRALTDTVLSLQETVNTVYFLSGTEADLTELGVIEKVGKGGRVLGIGPRRQQVTMVTGTLHASDFTPYNLDSDTVLVLPKPTVTYVIVSRQDLQALVGGAPRNGEVRGSVRIANPARFWAASRYLVLMEK
jgi:uncharacterized coiled-coil protein SlyX